MILKSKSGLKFFCWLSICFLSLQKGKFWFYNRPSLVKQGIKTRIDLNNVDWAVKLQPNKTGYQNYKGVFEHAQKVQIQIDPAHSQSHPGICRLLIHSKVSKNCVGGRRWPRSDCASAQSDQGLRCPHMPEDTFSHGIAQIMLSVDVLFIFIFLSRTDRQNINNIFKHPETNER